MTFDGKRGSIPTTLDLLIALYGPRPFVTLETIRQDYFTHLSMDTIKRKASLGDLPVPVVRLGDTNKSSLGVHIHDLAEYLDKRRAVAIRERDQISKAIPR